MALSPYIHAADLSDQLTHDLMHLPPPVPIRQTRAVQRRSRRFLGFHLERQGPTCAFVHEVCATEIHATASTSVNCWYSCTCKKSRDQRIITALSADHSLFRMMLSSGIGCTRNLHASGNKKPVPIRAYSFRPALDAQQQQGVELHPFGESCSTAGIECRHWVACEYACGYAGLHLALHAYPIEPRHLADQGKECRQAFCSLYYFTSVLLTEVHCSRFRLFVL